MDSQQQTALAKELERAGHDSHAGVRDFGQIVGSLVGLGVEAYWADFRAGSTTYYMPDGRALAFELRADASAIAEAFDAAAMRRAVVGAQSGAVKYPEFLRLSHAAGCVGYMVWIAGRHVAYYGRRGETHVEQFPGAA